MHLSPIQRSLLKVVPQRHRINEIAEILSNKYLVKMLVRSATLLFLP